MSFCESCGKERGWGTHDCEPDVEDMQREIDGQERLIEKLWAEIAELKKDKARIDWIDRRMFFYVYDGFLENEIFIYRPNGGYSATPSLREEIDKLLPADLRDLIVAKAHSRKDQILRKELAELRAEGEPDE